MYFLQWWWSSSSSSSSQYTPCSKSQNGFRDLHEKARIINLVLLEPSVDLWKLRDLALTEGGLVNDTLRKLAWPKLVGLYLLGKDSLSISSSPSMMMTTANPDQPLSAQSPHVETSSSGSGVHPDNAAVSMDSAPGLTNNTNTHQSLRTDPVGSLFVESLDVEQIQRDVDRCTWHLITGSQPSPRHQLLKKKQRRLANFINLALVESYPMTSSAKPTAMEQEPRLRYYQGYHDVACIFLHALGGAGTNVPAATTATASSTSDTLDLQLASQVLSRVSSSHLKDFCQDDFGRLQTTLHLTLYPLLYQLDPLVHNRLQVVDMEPFFCLSWILTWFSHNVRDTNLCTRLFDAFLASHPLLVLYVALAMILHPYNRKCILETECDFAALHHTLTNLPQHSCRVGWISIRDDDDDDGPGDGISHDCRQQEQHDSPIADDNPSTDLASAFTPSLFSSTHGGLDPIASTEQEQPCQVPFETLLDMALEYMAQYPPRSVHDLARQYYGPNHESVSKFNPISSKGSTTTTDTMNATRGCMLLQEAPTSCLRSTCPSDWVLKQRLQNRMGLSCTSSRKDRRKHESLEALTSEEKVALDEILLPFDDGTPDYAYLKRHATDRAVIAAGFGLGPEVAQSLRQQRIRYAKAVAVGFVAMSVGLGIQYYWYSKTNTTHSRKAAFIKTLIHPKRIHHPNHVLSTSVGDSIGVLEACHIPMACMLHHVGAEREEKPRVLAQSTKLDDLAHATTPPTLDTSLKNSQVSPRSTESEDLALSTTVVMDCATDKGLDKPRIAAQSSSAVEKDVTLSLLHILSQSTGANEDLELSPPPHQLDSVDSDDGPLGVSAQATELDEDLEISTEQAFPHSTAEMKETQSVSAIPCHDACVMESNLNASGEAPSEVESMPPVTVTPSTIENTNNVDMFILGPPGGMVNRIISKVHGIVLRSLEWLICRRHFIWNSLRKLHH